MTAQTAEWHPADSSHDGHAAAAAAGVLYGCYIMLLFYQAAAGFR
jgi:hypothetical protein